MSIVDLGPAAQRLADLVARVGHLHHQSSSTGHPVLRRQMRTSRSPA
jgi:hypothetical protein